MARAPGTALLTALCTLSFVLFACESQLGGDPSGGDPSTEGTGSTGGDGDGDDPAEGVEIVTVGDVECGSKNASSTPIRLLAADEWGSLVRRVFPGVELPDGALENLPQTLSSAGYLSNACATVDASHQERLLEIAESAADQVVTNWAEYSSCGLERTCAEAFARDRGRLTYRQSLDDEQLNQLLALYDAGEDPASGMRLLVQGLLLAPDVLYQFEIGQEEEDGSRRLSGVEVASKMAYVLWGTTPDAPLLDLAEGGGLDTAEGVAKVARTMLQDERASGVLRFFKQWLHFGSVGDKDADLFPEFTEGVAATAVEESERFVEHVLFDGDGRFETLVTDRTAFVTPALASIYGLATNAPAPGPAPEPVDPTGECASTAGCEQLYPNATDCNNGGGGVCMCGTDRCADIHTAVGPSTELDNETWEQVTLNPNERSGLFTRLAFLAATGGTAETSHVTRGVDMLANILCVEIPEPSAELQDSFPLIPDDPELTPQDIIELHQADPTCASCHVYIDGVGLGFEHYNSIGAYRTVYEKNGKPVDASGDLYTNVEGSTIDGPFEGALEFSERVATSDLGRSCFADNWFRFALLIEPGTDNCSLHLAEAAFASNDYDIRELIVGLMMSPDFRFRGGLE